MRRRVSLAVGLSAVVMLSAGVAGAAELNRPTAPRAPLMAAVTGQPEQRPPAGVTTGADLVGKVESVADGTLDVAGPRHAKTLSYPGADYVKVHFSRLLMAPTDTVTVADPSGAESYTYHAADLGDAGDWSMSVSGDTAVVTVRPEHADELGIRDRLANAGVTVDKVARGMTPAESKAQAVRESGREESVCGTDQKANVACYKSTNPVAYANSKPVARLLINGVELCTGWRVGPDNRMLTNHHCFTSSREAANTEVWFNYECARCGGFDTLRPTKVWGSRVLATGETLDYTLFTVEDFGAIQRFGYLTLDVRQPRNGEELYIPQHPRGEPTMIAMADPGERTGNCQVSDNAYNGYARNSDIAYYCDTEGGSSGSPVISRETNRVIGLHHFGGCPNSGVRIDLVYAEIGKLL